MKISVKDVPAEDIKCDALIIPLWEGQAPPRPIDSALGGLIKKVCASGEFKGRRAEALVLHTGSLIGPGRVLLAGLGKKGTGADDAMTRAGGASVKKLRGLASAALYTGTCGSVSPARFVEGALLGSYEFTAYKKSERKQLGALTVLAEPGKSLSSEIKYARTVARSVNFARDLVNTPAREMTPTALVRAARSIKGITVRVLDRAAARKLGMDSYLSVSGGSAEPPRFILASYKGRGAAARPTVLVGKSVTFDSGGLSLKPASSMETMKYDMAGGAAVLGAVKAASELKLKVNLVALLPATENLPGGASPNKPGDVVRAMDGTTIEVLNTDAEGRLALADAIAYAAKKLKPASIIDIATLTGACNVALGAEAMALMGNDDGLIKAIARAGEQVHERAWHMPLYEEYAEYIKGDIADIRNISRRRSGGLVTAGFFLKRFAGDTPWAHLDIAGTAWADKPGPYTAKGATGIGVRLLMNYIASL